LVEIRASQINGCAWCLDMHTKDAMESGESPQRIFLLNAWQESPQFTNREKMALKWTEAVTLISENQITNDLFEEVSKEFNEVELVELTGAVISINSWNRANIAFQMIPGDYVSKRKKNPSDED
jgi:AhpD family alkylhydroperoxidase